MTMKHRIIYVVAIEVDVPRMVQEDAIERADAHLNIIAEVGALSGCDTAFSRISHGALVDDDTFAPGAFDLDKIEDGIDKI